MENVFSPRLVLLGTRIFSLIEERKPLTSCSKKRLPKFLYILFREYCHTQQNSVFMARMHDFRGKFNRTEKSIFDLIYLPNIRRRVGLLNNLTTFM